MCLRNKVEQISKCVPYPVKDLVSEDFPICEDLETSKNEKENIESFFFFKSSSDCKVPCSGKKFEIQKMPVGKGKLWNSIRISLRSVKANLHRLYSKFIVEQDGMFHFKKKLIKILSFSWTQALMSS